LEPLVATELTDAELEAALSRIANLRVLYVSQRRRKDLSQ
jgi:hypothetical protein